MSKDYEIPITLEQYNSATQVTKPKADKSRTLSIRGTSYNLDTSDFFREVSQWAANGRKMHLVSIEEKSGQEVTNARIWGDEYEVETAAQVWINELLVMNPGKFLRFSIRVVKN